jgi:hypothetical protein
MIMYIEYCSYRYNGMQNDLYIVMCVIMRLAVHCAVF